MKRKSNFPKIRFTLATLVSGLWTFDFRLSTLLLLLTFNFTVSTSCSAQKKPKPPKVKVISAPSTTLIYDDINYIPSIKSVEFYNDNKKGSFPLITLGTQEKLRLDFDDLRNGSHSLYYSVVHCVVNWQPSLLSPIEYLESFGEDRINDYRLSFNTFQTYTHYRLELPNFSVIPKVSGNYLLKVYEDGDATKLLLTRRFYILNQKVSLQAEITRSNLVQQRDEYQKINFSVLHPGLDIQNPYIEVKAVVMQNGRSDKTQLTEKPLFIRNNQLIYSDDRINDFKAGNEFRRFDTRSFRYKSEGVAQIVKDSLYEILLFPNGSLNTKSYSYQFDEDGNFFIINQDGTTNDYDADYGNVHFSLRAPAPDANGFAYIVGKFNAYQLNNQNRMIYDPQKKQFTLNMPLKQGVYDYHYVWGTEEGETLDDTIFDGSFYQTENNYQILIYYRAPGARYDEVIAFTQLNTATNPRNY